MSTTFTQHITARIELSGDEISTALSFFAPRRISKKAFFLREGEPCLFHAFVEKGALRSYTIDDKGKEHISAFALEGHWLSDLRSFCGGGPARFNIDAIEESNLLLITLENTERLCLEIPKFERYFRILYQRSIGNLSYKLDDSLKLAAKERYNNLVFGNPDIINRVPQHYIASFLGITPESLSRIRKSTKS